ncbi:unnamed protein product [Calicophoron daubneyi]|uniref:Uncharacterized protein n=1 Tax=Calicophoron daubneyi TaxID=300641 RepID=A0AAV2TF75_CALDB
MQKREDSGITHRKYHQTDKKGVANGPTSPTFSVRPMSFGRFKGEKRISSGSSSNSVFENTTQVIPSLASVKDVIDRLKKEVDSERIKRVSIAKQRSEDLLKLVLRSKNDQRPNEPKARRRLKDWHRIDFKNGCSKRSRLCNASADNLFAFISEPHLPTANSQPDIHRSFEDQSDTVQLLAGNLSGKPLDKEGKDDIFHRGKFGSLAFLEKLVKTSANCFEPTENKCTSHLTLQQPTFLRNYIFTTYESSVAQRLGSHWSDLANSYLFVLFDIHGFVVRQLFAAEMCCLESTVAAQEREVSLLKQQAEAEKSKNNLLVEQIRRLLEERTILVLQNTELVSRSRALQQINADQRYLDKVLSRIESIVGQAKTENLTLQSQMDRVLQDLGSPNGEESVETLRAKLRELEKRCALQQLRHEEVLLELEDVRKRTRQELGTYAHSAETGVSLDSVYRSTTDLVAPYLQNTLTNNNVLPVAEGRLYSGVMETGITVSGTALSTPLSTQMQIRGRLFGNSIAAVNKYPSMPERTEGKDPNLVELFQTADGLPEKNDIPSPRMITLERQLIHSVLISWKPPDYSSTGHSVSAYHVYVDGQFRLSVKAKEKTRALIDKVDADKASCLRFALRIIFN